MDREIDYQKYLLENAIIGLSCLQHKGHMILKIESVYTQFTLDLIFILYSLF